MLKVLRQIPDYLLKDHYYACRGEIQSDDEVAKYKETWLHYHYLTVLQ